LFHVALNSTEPGIRQNILGSTLPNLIGLSDAGAALSAEQVFQTRPRERARILHALEPFQGEESAAKLAAWLKR
jgi:hypothetical protein